MNQLELVATSSAATRISHQTEVVSSERALAFVYLRHRLHNALNLAVGDALALSLSLLAAGVLRLWWMGEAVIPIWSWLILPMWWGGAFILRLLPSWGLGPVEELRRVTGLLFATFGFMAAVLFLSKQADDTSRLVLTIALSLSLVTLPLTRLRVRRALVKVGTWGVPTVIYGASEATSTLVHVLRQEAALGYNPIGVFDDDPGLRGETIEGLPVLGPTHLVSRAAPIAILAMPGADRRRRIELLEGPLSHYRKVVVIPDLFEAPSLWVKPRDLGGILGLEITSNLTSPLTRLLKRAADILLVSLSAPFWMSISALLAALIWLEDRESPFFLQTRVGQDGRPFQTWKFRTMVPNAEAVLRKRLAEDDELRREWETSYKLKKDPRITRVGNYLRRLSLDELPQLWNVLRGDMSLVGPRPLPHYHHDELPRRVRDLRERVRPGLTGLWQVSGRSDIGNEGMERWDPYYVRNWSLWLDVVILIRTARIVIKGSGAY